MEKLTVGTRVNISRSNGRIQSAIVSNIRFESNVVDVEWFESNETKGKPVPISTLLRDNPSIVLPKIDPKTKRMLTKPIQPSMDDSDATVFMTPQVATYPKIVERTAVKPKPNITRNGDQNDSKSANVSRSNGKVNSAAVKKLRPEQNLVDVEWVETDETKTKAYSVESILKTNPELVALPKTKSKCKQAQVDQDLSIIEIPNPAIKVQSRKIAKNPKPVVSKIQVDQDVSVIEIPPPVTSKVRRGSLAAKPRQTMTASKPRRVSLATKSRQTMVIPKSTEPKVIPIKSSGSTFAVAEKDRTVVNSEQIERNRIERRAKQAEERRMRNEIDGLEPGNPNWEFFTMIRDFCAELDIRPISLSDPVIDERICVCIRKRPLSKKEKNKKEIDIITIPTKEHIYLHQPKFRVDLSKHLENQKFRFDYVFDESIDNEMVYHFTAKPLVETVFQGGFATCFAYGQTGSGKTYTMGGQFEGKVQDCSNGIYALCANDVFDYLDRSEYSQLDLYVVCSFFELYGSKPFDLLSERTERRILEDQKKNVQIVGLKEVEVSSADEVLKLIREGSLLRTAGQTSANDNSSRSHAIFQIILRRNDNSALHGKFSLIDLAGSERGADTKTSDAVVRREGGEINKSLLALKECIRSMGMNKQHVPFRQSKLTLVLRDSFIGKNAKTCMIATISPGLLSSENTLNTLRYANRAKELDSDISNVEELDSAATCVIVDR